MRALTIFIFLSTAIFGHAFAQLQSTHSTKLMVDSAGNVFTQTDAAAYLFIARADTTGQLLLIPSTDKEANPMQWDGDGIHHITYRNAQNDTPVNFKVMADGTAPVSTPYFTRGLLFSYDNTFFADINAEVSIKASDNMTGVASTYFSKNLTPFQPFDEPIVLDKECDFPLKVYSVDNVGNTEEIQEYRIITTQSAEIPLKNIYFRLGSTELTTGAKEEIIKLATILHTYPNVYLEIRAHTDSRGSEQFNQTLSEGRAQAVVNKLKAQGIPERRLSAKGFGESQLVNECADGVICAEDKHEENRRVELFVLKHLP